MKELQLISFEVGNGCNLSHVHPWCPSNRPERYADRIDDRPMTDEAIGSFLEAAVGVGFCGRVAFHYYNEPTMQLDRCAVIAGIASRLGLKSCLWTNGTKRDIPEGLFDDVFATAYDLMPDGVTRAMPYHPDSRIEIYQTEPTKDSVPPCYRPAVLEMPINYYGDIRMCCADWKGTVRVGNIMRDAPDDIFVMWSRVANWAEYGAPEVCRACHAMRYSPALMERGFRLWA